MQWFLHYRDVWECHSTWSYSKPVEFQPIGVYLRNTLHQMWPGHNVAICLNWEIFCRHPSYVKTIQGNSLNLQSSVIIGMCVTWLAIYGCQWAYVWHTDMRGPHYLVRMYYHLSKQVLWAILSIPATTEPICCCQVSALTTTTVNGLGWADAQPTIHHLIGVSTVGELQSSLANTLFFKFWNI